MLTFFLLSFLHCRSIIDFSFHKKTRLKNLKSNGLLEEMQDSVELCIKGEAIMKDKDTT